MTARPTLSDAGPPIILALRAEDAAAAIGVSVSTFQALVEEGKMPKPVTIPGHRIVRFDVESVRNAWEALKEGAANDDAGAWDRVR